MLYKISIRLDLLFLLSYSVHQSAGNATKRETYAFTTGTLGSVTATKSYTYDTTGTWKDLLTSANGYTIEYDGIGNPTKIYKDYGDYEMGWVLEWKGRQLMSYREYELFYEVGTYDYYSTTTYTYNADGIRTSKTVDGVKHEYILNGSQIVAEKWTENGIEYMLTFVYDETGAPIGMKYRTSAYAEGVYDYYFYEKNLQGDIVAVYNEDGIYLLTYKYDAWGNWTAQMSSRATLEEFVFVRDINPFRYRGYYYDQETGWYYLQSRYYNPSWCRFINADGVTSLEVNSTLQRYNLFAYCVNNPVMLGTHDSRFGIDDWCISQTTRRHGMLVKVEDSQQTIPDIDGTGTTIDSPPINVEDIFDNSGIISDSGGDTISSAQHSILEGGYIQADVVESLLGQFAFREKIYDSLIDASLDGIKGLVEIGCVSLGKKIGTAIYPGIGTAIGTGVGTLLSPFVGELFSLAVEELHINGKTIKEWLKGE